MTQSHPEHRHEIVIVRRRDSGDHDEHHGGVWKVAFADFMTAMMAFFLVLWIVNSTTKQTRSSLARYFNPIRLSDTTPARKGLNDPREVDFDASPDAVDRKDGGAKEVHSTQVGDGAGRPGGSKPREDRHGIDVEVARRMEGTSPTTGSRDEFADPFSLTKAPKSTATDVRAIADSAGRRTNDAESLRANIVAAFGQDQAVELDKALDVVEVREGVLISLTERADLGSFAIGSSEPEDKLIRVLTAIAMSLKGRPEAIVVRGHTDSRPYRGRGDNWRLSIARAQTALFSLVRAGLDESRIERIEGYADHLPRNPASPQASENRRIEILLRRAPSQ